jgi:CRP-like cAMP-binding protein
MKSFDTESWKHPELDRFVRKFTQGTTLFKQGAPGETFFLILSGVVHLTAERDGQDLMVSTLQAGDILGEKCLISDKAHKRFFGATAFTQVTAAELRPGDMAALEEKAPALALSIFKKVCQVSIGRVDRIDHMVKVLRSADNVERLVYLIVHFAYFEGAKQTGGYEVILPVQTIRYYIAMSPFEIEECLNELNRRGIFVSEGNDRYRLTDQEALLQSIKSLKEVLPDIRTI